MRAIINISILCLLALGAFAQSTNTYEYDNLNRLTKVTFANGAVVQYSYDAVGNRLTKTVAGAYVSYTVTATADPTTGGSVTGGGTFQHGQSCTLTATANSGYTFVNWTKNGTQVSTNATYTFTVTESAAFVANFTANPVNYTITVSANPSVGGTVDGGGSFIQGQNCTLTATASSGYSFTNWTENSSVVSTDATYSFMVTGDRTLVANFEQNASYPTLLSDDFNDGVIDPEQWTYTGNAVLEEEGLLKLQQNVTDQEVHLRSINLNVPADGKVDMVRKFMVHRANNYYNGRHTIQLNGDQNSIIQIEYVYTEYYDNAYHHSDPKTGVYLIVKLDGVETETRLCDVDFDTWLIESVEVDFTAGTLSYNMNTSVNTVTIPGLAEQTVNHYNVEYGPYGWNTGHYHYMDYVNINVNSYTHTKPIDAGWNWWSTYIEMDGSDGLTQLEHSLGSIGMMIKSRSDGYVEPYNYNGSTGWFGNLSSLSNEQMYKIEVSEDGNAAVAGTVTGTSSHPITINSGWNWIGYPMNQSVSVETALSGFSPTVEDLLKGREDYAIYYDDDWESGWFGTLNTLDPGCGYMYHSLSSGTKTLVYQTGRGEATVDNITPENNINKPVDQRFADNMVVTAVVEMVGEELRSDAYELAAFADGECRGSVKLIYVEPLDRYVAFLTVFGETGDELEFRLTDGMETQVSSDVLAFTTDGVAGTLTSLKVLHFGPLGMDETLAMVRIYPNPVRRKGALNIAFPEASGVLTVEIANVLGVTVYKSEVVVGPTSEAHFTLPDAVLPGTYVLKATRHDGTVYYGKLVVE